jgi:hypothetical protein
MQEVLTTKLVSSNTLYYVTDGSNCNNSVEQEF